MGHSPRYDLPIPLLRQLSVSVQDWEIQLELTLHEDVPHLDALMALHGKTVQITLVDAAPEENAS